MAFGELAAHPPDGVLALMQRFRVDSRSWKMDLGVGVYRDAYGSSPVFAAVKLAERLLLESQNTKTYLGSEGDPEFVQRLKAEALDGTAGERLVGVQCVGGTGALRLAAELLAQTQTGRRLWMGLPSWPNHLPICAAARLATQTVDLSDPATAGYRPEALLDALQGEPNALGERDTVHPERPARPDSPALADSPGRSAAGAQPGDAVLVHACCHNPTGVDGGLPFWERLADIVIERRLVPVVDMAYQGLGRGWDEDAAGVRLLAARVPHLLVAYSCDKNFGLYRERVGALFMQGANAAESHRLFDHAVAIARANYSMPPDHGAATVRTILESGALRASWRNELDGMRTRLRELRAALAARGRVGCVDLSTLARGDGLFAVLPLSGVQIDRLQSDHAIYLAPSGRINIAGLAAERIDAFVDALRAVQRKHAA
jgi:aromatic-amino-acid transaminase